MIKLIEKSKTVQVFNSIEFSYPINYDNRVIVEIKY